MGKHLQTAIAECTGGAVAGGIADFVLYAIDSAKVRKQSTPVVVSGNNSIKILFRGLVPTIALGSVPVFGSFFFIYAPIRDITVENGYQQLLPFVSAICAIPATIIGVPADVIKKHLVLGIDANVSTAIRTVSKSHGYRGLFAGWHVNLIRDLPFAAVKIGLYEKFIELYKNHYYHYNGEGGNNNKSSDNNDSNGVKIPTHAVAGCGIASGMCCAVLTCPLDVVNTRIKADRAPSLRIIKVMKQIIHKEGIRALFRGVVLRSAVLGVGSSIFWPIQHHVSHYLNPSGEEFEKSSSSFLDRITEF